MSSRSRTEAPATRPGKGQEATARTGPAHPEHSSRQDVREDRDEPAGSRQDHVDTRTRSRDQADPGKGRPGKRSRGEVENPDYAAFATRIIRTHGRRIADGDIDSLPDLLRLTAELDTATQHAVTGLRAFGYSWAEIAARLGTTRQAAQQRWGR